MVPFGKFNRVNSEPVNAYGNRIDRQIDGIRFICMYFITTFLVKCFLLATKFRPRRVLPEVDRF